MSVSREFKDINAGKWITAPISISAEVTAPTKASSATKDTFKYAVVGDTVFCNLSYFQPNNTGAAAGSGGYLFRLPFPAKYVNSISFDNDVVGTCHLQSGSNFRSGDVILANESFVYFQTSDEGATNDVTMDTTVGSTAYDLTTAGTTAYKAVFFYEKA